MELKPLRSADKKYMKITFYLSEELYANYRDLQRRAKSLGYKLDLTRDFSIWFAQQIEEADNSLKKIEKR